MIGSNIMRILFFIGIIIPLLATDVIADSQGKAVTIGRVIATGKERSNIFIFMSYIHPLNQSKQSFH